MAPTTTTNSWKNTFNNAEQQAHYPLFQGLLRNKLQNVERISTACSADQTGFLIIQPNGSVKILHHLHHDTGTAFVPGSGEVWGLYGPDESAAPVIIPQQSFAPRDPFNAPAWDDFASCSAVDDLKSIAAEPDPVSVEVCNVMPIPAFLTRDLMASRSTVAGVLAFAALQSIRNEASALATRGLAPIDVVDTTASVKELGACFGHIVQVLWEAEDNDDPIRVYGFQIDPAISTAANDWSRQQHRHFLSQPLLQGPSAVPAATTAAFTTAMEALKDTVTLLQPGRLAAATANSSRSESSFDALPVLVQRMLLHASAPDPGALVRTDPVPTGAEILALKSASFVQQHLHHHLRRDPFNLDIGLPYSICTAIKTGQFTSLDPERPGMYSLFSCYRTHQSATDLSQSDAAIMNLKAYESTAGLSDKDVARLVKGYHHGPESFPELRLLCNNFSGVNGMLLGPKSPVSTALTAWGTWLDKGSLQPLLRSLTNADPLLPAKVGWYIECRLQRYFISCSEAQSIDKVDTALLSFHSLQVALSEGRDFGLSLCPALRQKLQRPAREVTPSPPRQRGSGNRPPHNQSQTEGDPVTNSNLLYTFMPRKDDWDTFIHQSRSCPVPDVCLKFHIKGRCHALCARAGSHSPVTEPAEILEFKSWIAVCHEIMPPPSKRRAKPSRATVTPYAIPSSSPSNPIPLTVPLSAADIAFHSTPIPTPSAPLPFPFGSRPSPSSPGKHLPSPPVLLASPTPAPPSPPSPPPRGNAPLHAGSTHSTPAPPTAAPPSPSPPHSTPGGAAPFHVGSTISTPALPPSTSPRPFHPTHTDTGVPIQPSIQLPPPPTALESLPTILLHDIISSLLAQPSPPVDKPLFDFEWTQKAARHNAAVLGSFNWDLQRAINAHPFCAVTIGSEFRPAHLLAPLVESHPLWPRFRTRISTGSQHPLAPLDNDIRLRQLESMIQRGNHKSAIQYDAKLVPMLQDEVSRGWQLPLPPRVAKYIPSAVIAPVGMVLQSSIDADARAIEKYRLTHDQSFNIDKSLKCSVNDRLDVGQLSPYRYGRAIHRLIHAIVYFRYRRPTARLLLTKFDWKSAYRRVHLSADTAVQSMVVVDELLLVALRQTFGGAANPSQWSDISEIATDLSNDIVRRRDWDPAVMCSPHQARMPDAHDADADLDLSLPFATARPLDVPFPADDLDPRFDCFLDDIFGVMLEEDEARGAAVVPLVLELLGRPLAELESLPRDVLLSLKKFLAEARPSECKIILGWDFNTRSLLLRLPNDKFIIWSRDLDGLIRRRSGKRSELETLLGRLNHSVVAIPMGRHFLGRLYSAESQAKRRGFVKFTQAQVDDLLLWVKFLAKANIGISLNQLCFRSPNRVIRIDACPHGIGGYTLTSGVAWRWLLPEHLRNRVSLNALEFVAIYVGIWMKSIPVHPSATMKSSSAKATAPLHLVGCTNPPSLMPIPSFSQ